MRAFRAAGPAVLMALLAAAGVQAQKSPSTATATRVALTVDGIMRGPDLVGWPPTAVRWSADSAQLYFDWRRPGEKEASTYVVGRGGAGLRRLSEDDAKHAPPASGRWDAERRRAIAVEDGDVIIYDGGSGRRTFVTRTSGAESGPRWARKDTHVTYVRDGNLFVVRVDAGGGSALTERTSCRPSSCGIGRARWT